MRAKFAKSVTQSLLNPRRKTATESPEDRGARAVSRAVMDCLEPVAWGESAPEETATTARAAVDVAGKLRAMWS